ncbi:hypothetical protein IQ13_0964 [Lacibacter cauensis]|uniref:Uncharacterized protein n=1 Tax=Lacibacter cauensis TaxID=510947 RepID=A0A562SWX4_9BACT|nr:hypothetical protein [Lacibacter cauensis]TWI85795.1 hypothetical protein IQ13_0964 [Lacibacter cauensis]
MKAEKLLMLAGIISLLCVSCSTSGILLDLPEEMNGRKVETITIAGVKGKGITGTKRRLKFDHTYSGMVKDGWHISADLFDKTPGAVFSAEATRRSLLANLGLDVNDVVSKTVDSYQFSIADTANAFLVFCSQQYLGKSTNYKADGKADFSIARQQLSKFRAALIPPAKTAMDEWYVEMGFDRVTPGGVLATTVREGMPQEKGFLTNKKDTIFIESLFIKAARPANTEKGMVKVTGGYMFTFQDQIIGSVDLFNSSCSFFNVMNANQKLVVAAAASALLLRNR